MENAGRKARGRKEGKKEEEKNERSRASACGFARGSTCTPDDRGRKNVEGEADKWLWPSSFPAFCGHRFADRENRQGSHVARRHGTDERIKSRTEIEGVQENGTSEWKNRELFENRKCHDPRRSTFTGGLFLRHIPCELTPETSRHDCAAVCLRRRGRTSRRGSEAARKRTKSRRSPVRRARPTDRREEEYSLTEKDTHRETHTQSREQRDVQ